LGTHSKVRIVVLMARCAANVAAFLADNPVNVVKSAYLFKKE
jgi:hypothetical protein